MSWYSDYVALQEKFVSDDLDQDLKFKSDLIQDAGEHLTDAVEWLSLVKDCFSEGDYLSAESYARDLRCCVDDALEFIEKLRKGDYKDDIDF